jgi:hypothetical protein
MSANEQQEEDHAHIVMGNQALDQMRELDSPSILTISMHPHGRFVTICSEGARNLTPGQKHLMHAAFGMYLQNPKDRR